MTSENTEVVSDANSLLEFKESKLNEALEGLRTQKEIGQSLDAQVESLSRRRILCVRSLAAEKMNCPNFSLCHRYFWLKTLTLILRKYEFQLVMHRE